MRNIKLVLAYDGTDFHGWQRQRDVRTVQEVLETAIETLTGAHSEACASGRTDAGVHAIGLVAHFYTASSHSVNTVVQSLNALLPRDVRVISACDMPQSFHATVDALSKRYRYLIDNRSIAWPFTLRYAWHLPNRLDDVAMSQSAQALSGRHDFRSFETEWPNRISSVRTIHEISVVRNGDELVIEVEADGFLYNMVRCIVGTLAYVGKGKRPQSWVAEVLRAEDRRAAGPNAPAQGLYLVNVRYRDSTGVSPVEV